MVMQDILTQVSYQLPIINVVFQMIHSDLSKQNKKILNNKNLVFPLNKLILGKACEALGADGFTITHYEQLRPAFNALRRNLIDQS